jgi:hypothetical protein
MGKILAAHQPNFCPWLGFFEKFLVADHFVLMDEVMYKRRDYINRVQVTAPNKEGVVWLTQSVEPEEYGKTPICHMKLTEHWGGPILDRLTEWYPSWESRLVEAFNDIDVAGHPSLARVNAFALLHCHFWAKWPKERHPVVTMGSAIRSGREKTERIIEYCRAFNCTIYFSGSGAKDYLDEQLMLKEGIKVVWQTPHPFKYKQKFSKDFKYGMSILDALLNDADLMPVYERAVELRERILNAD